MSVWIKDWLILFHDDHSNIVGTEITHRDTKWEIEREQGVVKQSTHLSMQELCTHYIHWIYSNHQHTTRTTQYSKYGIILTPLDRATCCNGSNHLLANCTQDYVHTYILMTLLTILMQLHNGYEVNNNWSVHGVYAEVKYVQNLTTVTGFTDRNGNDNRDI